MLARINFESIVITAIWTLGDTQYCSMCWEDHSGLGVTGWVLASP